MERADGMGMDRRDERRNRRVSSAVAEGHSARGLSLVQSIELEGVKHAGRLLEMRAVEFGSDGDTSLATGRGVIRGLAIAYAMIVDPYKHGRDRVDVVKRVEKLWMQAAKVKRG